MRYDILVFLGLSAVGGLIAVMGVMGEQRASVDPQYEPLHVVDVQTYLLVTMEQLEAERLVTELVGPDGHTYSTKLNVLLHYDDEDGETRPIRDLIDVRGRVVCAPD